MHKLHINNIETQNKKISYLNGYEKIKNKEKKKNNYHN